MVAEAIDWFTAEFVAGGAARGSVTSLVAPGAVDLPPVAVLVQSHPVL
jgi:hypothetical protein